MLRLTYLEPAASSQNNGRMAKYRCACDRTVVLPLRKVLNGDIHSCGCWRREVWRQIAASQRTGERIQRRPW